jgi:hypothetical protein
MIANINKKSGQTFSIKNKVAKLITNSDIPHRSEVLKHNLVGINIQRGFIVLNAFKQITKVALAKTTAPRLLLLGLLVQAPNSL